MVESYEVLSQWVDHLIPWAQVISILNVLFVFRYRKNPIKAQSGEDSSKARILGRRGDDLKLKVPIGVTVFDETNQKIGELNEPGETCIVAQGGIGGCSGNNFLGTRGKEQVITLDLKLIADVGMVFIPYSLLKFTLSSHTHLYCRSVFLMLARVHYWKQFHVQHQK